MFKKIYYGFGAALTAGMMTSPKQALAAAGGGGGGTSGSNFSAIAENITESISDVPGLISALAYLMGVLIGVLGIMKIKDHVENPTQTPLKDGAIRLAAGGALFALPIITEAMMNTIGEGEAVDVAKVNRVQLGLE